MAELHSEMFLMGLDEVTIEPGAWYQNSQRLCKMRFTIISFYFMTIQLSPFSSCSFAAWKQAQPSSQEEPTTADLD
jgi:hypothetical protein